MRSKRYGRNRTPPKSDVTWPTEVRHGHPRSPLSLINLVFRADHPRVTGYRRFQLCLLALLIKRWHVMRRQHVFVLGFFLLPILIEIIMVAALPSPKQIQGSLLQNDHVTDAQMTLLPSIYNAQTIVTYANSDADSAQARLLEDIQYPGATIDRVANDTVLDYVRQRYLVTEDSFIHKYQMAFALHANVTSSRRSLVVHSYFSTVNYHAMPTSLGASATSLFQFYANSSDKRIITTNKPIVISSKSYSSQEQFFQIIYCFDTLPLSLFNFLNAIVAALFISILTVPLIQERISRSKDLQLLANLSKRTYWLSNALFDLACCLIVCALLTVIVKVQSTVEMLPLCRLFTLSDRFGS